MNAATYFESIDPAALTRQFPLGDAFLTEFTGMSADELRTRQDALFKRAVARAWSIPFYRRLWGAAGVVAADIRALADIAKLPAFGDRKSVV